MNKLLDKKLCKKYPELFKDRNGDMRKTAMCWGFECGDGWFKLIDELCAEIMQVCDYVPVVTQVKEKYGTLSFYIDSGNDAVYKALVKAERKSGHICEVCGKRGKIRSNKVLWIRTLCDKDAKNYE